MQLEIILAINIVRCRNLIAHETNPELRARLEETLARDLQVQQEQPPIEEPT